MAKRKRKPAAAVPVETVDDTTFNAAINAMMESGLSPRTARLAVILDAVENLWAVMESVNAITEDDVHFDPMEGDGAMKIFAAAHKSVSEIASRSVSADVRDILARKHVRLVDRGTAVS